MLAGEIKGSVMMDWTVTTPLWEEAKPWPLPLWKMLTPESGTQGDRKSTRLNSSHQIISYAVFCLKKKNNNEQDLLEMIYKSDTLTYQSLLTNNLLLHH